VIASVTILLAFNDITARRAIEKEKEHLLGRTEELLRQKEVLLREMEHFQAGFMAATRDLWTLGYKHTGDRLDNWSRRWEYPFAASHLLQFAETNPSIQVMDAKTFEAAPKAQSK
jgi:hypothetical protein